MDEVSFPLVVDYEKVSKDKYFAPFVRLLAMDMMENPYISIGTFLQRVSDSDLKDFLSLVEEDEDKALETLVILTEMLSQAEGIRSENLDELTEKSNNLITYFILESLRRKGAVRIYYDNLSFGEEFKDKIIVERLQ